MKINIYIIYNNIKQFFQLRTSLFWSVVSFLILCSLLFIVRWEESEVFADNIEPNSLEMVKLRLAGSRSEADILISNKSNDISVNQAVKEKGVSNSGNENDYFAFGKILQRPSLMYDDMPEYPPSMRKSGIEGKVLIEIGISKTGNLLYNKIIKSPGREFDLAVTRWVKLIRFRPAYDRNNTPINCRVRFPVSFSLE